MNKQGFVRLRRHQGFVELPLRVLQSIELEPEVFSEKRVGTRSLGGTMVMSFAGQMETLHMVFCAE